MMNRRQTEGKGPVPGDGTILRSAIYIASPLGFSAPTRFYYEKELLPRLATEGYELLDPWADEDGQLALALGRANGHKHSDERRAELERVDKLLGERNVRLINRADAILAILDGTDVDSGTAAEIGYAAAQGRPIVGLRTDFRRTGENEGCTVNLQVEYFIRASGGSIVLDLGAAISTLTELLGRKKPDDERSRASQAVEGTG